MKSQFQTLSFLSNFQPKSELDREMIVGFIEKRFNITPKTPIFAAGVPNSSIDAQSFIKWFQDGYAASEVVKYKNILVMIGKCTDTEASIIGMLHENLVEKTDLEVSVEDLSRSSIEETRSFQVKMLNCGLQFNEETVSLTEKYIPKHDEKIIFHSFDGSIKGIGVVRNVNPETYEVELYCYFIYPSKHCQRQIGYSMNESGVVNLRDYVFEPMMGKDHRVSSLDGISCTKRLNRELGREHKVWKETQHRIEPLEPKVKKGERYWYINDKLKVTSDVEKDTPTSHLRYLAGNYFVLEEAAIVMLGEIRNLVTNYLASPEWPLICD